MDQDTKSKFSILNMPHEVKQKIIDDHFEGKDKLLPISVMIADIFSKYELSNYEVLLIIETFSSFITKEAIAKMLKDEPK